MNGTKAVGRYGSAKCSMSVLAVTLTSSGLELDLQKQARQGFPEVVFGRGKTGDQVVNAMKGLVAANGHCLATGIGQAMSELLVNRVENCIWHIS